MWRVLYIIYAIIVVGGVTISNSSVGKYSSSGTSSWGGGSSGRSGYSSSGSHK
ncbi:hypothetical protein [Bordetella genomosp. 10]|uniref:hypothetical protein n=1 Tax=Bordetella genomosp. 10 TaxID=1416804 RepID=UPI0015C60320|nr:hypothetical protein [Bordetella genomosp. 10]